VEGKAKVIAFANQKGGVAKTTTTLNLAVAFAEEGHRVLCCDMDPQGNLTMSQGIDPDTLDKSMYDVLVHDTSIREVVRKREVDVACASIDLAGERAVAQTKMTISQRAEVDDVLCDVVCTGRFYDFLERRAERWGIVLRQPIYEKDRLDPVDPAASLKLDPERLGRFPAGYRHLGYAQSSIGFEVKRDMPGLTGPVVEDLYRRGAQWLAGGALENPWLAT